MKQEFLSIARGIKFPNNAVTEKMAFLGKTNSGKTYSAMKVCEEMLKINAQIVVLDPVGKWYGLQTLKNGKRGFSIPVFGGLHGDIPLQSTSGILVADLIVDKNISAVIDVSQFETDTEKTRFATDFSARLFFRKKASSSPLHLFVEECQEFIPQVPQKGEERMLHNFQRIWKIGRNFGIGGSLISQRPQEINKKALNQTECIFSFQMTGPHEKKAIEDWVGAKGFAEKENVKDLLPKLKNGECYLWSPVWLDIVQLIKVDEKETIDISATPKLGQKAIKPAKLSSFELTEIKNAMAETMQQIQDNDPDELKKKIKELEKQLKGKQVVVQVPVKDNSEAIELRSQLAEAKKKLIEYEKWKTNVLSTIEWLKTIIDKDCEKLVSKIPPPLVETKTDKKYHKVLGNMYNQEHEDIKRFSKSAKNIAPAPFNSKEIKKYNPDWSVSSSNGSIGKGEKAVLIALAQFRDGLSRTQISVMIQYAKSSRDAYIHRLKEKGLVTTEDKIKITETGIELLGNDYKPLPVGDELREHWLNTLPQGEKVMLDLICSVYPNSITRDNLAGKSGYAKSSRDAYLHRMLNKEIIEIVNRGEVKASESLFS